MRVVTLDNVRFNDACRRLAHEVLASGWQPDMVVGIRTGGAYVAEQMMPLLSGADLRYVELHRSSTPKKGKLRRFLSYLPEWVLNSLRIMEAIVLSRRRADSHAGWCLPEDLTVLGEKRIIVVDDAVDSGATMLTVVRAMREKNPSADVRAAAITVTTAQPLIEPDFFLFHNKILIRFPWSMDARKV